MVTELCQLHLKRVGESIKQVLEASEMLEKREAMKWDIAEVNVLPVQSCRKMCHMEGSFEKIQMIMGYRSMSECKLKTTQNRENSHKFLDQLNTLDDTAISVVQEKSRRQKMKMSQCDHQHLSSKTKKTNEVGISPHLVRLLSRT